MSFYGQVVDAEKLRQERDQWQAEALQLREKNEALRKRLESATDFDFGTHTVYFNQRKKWMAYVGGRCVKCTLPGLHCLLGIGPKEPTEVSTSCGFDTFEEADAAALKALEVAG